MVMEIKVGNGCSNIIFGMSEKDVKDVLYIETQSRNVFVRVIIYEK